MIKSKFKTLAVAVGILALAGCSSVVEIPERKAYAQPKWYAECAQAGVEGYLWWSKDYAYACGAGESRYQQAAEEQMYAVAMNNFAKRINGKVNSETNIEFINDKRSTKTVISYTVDNTRITQHLQEERGTYIYAGNHYTFVKLKMPKEIFDRLVIENRPQ
jgi:hypothetical protein